MLNRRAVCNFGSVYLSLRKWISTIVTMDSRLRGNDCALVGNDCALVGNDCALVGNDCALVGNGCALVGNDCALVGNDCALVGNDCALVGNDCALVGNGCALVGNDCALVGNGCALVGYDKSHIVYKRVNHGFTLIEMMVVVVILGILAALVVPKIMGRPDEARIVKARHDIRAIEAALKLYKLDNYVYPSTDQGLEALVTKPQGEPQPRQWKEGGYLERLPKDPWAIDYLYLNPGTHGEIDIYSLGADGQAGGSGVNADIGNWRLE